MNKLYDVQRASKKVLHPGGQLFLELFSKSYVVELELSFQNPEFNILDCQNPEFKILDFQQTKINLGK